MEEQICLIKGPSGHAFCFPQEAAYAFKTSDNYKLLGTDLTMDEACALRDIHNINITVE